MNSKKFGFSGLYDDLIDELTFSWLRKVAVPVILLFPVLGISYNFGMLMTVERILPSQFATLALALLMLFIVSGILLGIIFGIFTNLAGVTYRAATLSVKLAVANPHPFKKTSGLSYSDLERLKAIAQVEQSAAGWQGGLLSFAVIWFLAENLSLFTDPVNELISAAQRAQNVPQFSIHGIGWMIEWLLVLLVICIVTFVVFKLIYDFLGNEPANRALIKSCEDAQSVLNHLGLKNKTDLTIRDKQRIAEFCEYVYVLESKIPKKKIYIPFRVKERRNQDYVLITSKSFLKSTSK